eukprot:TRINITY_DN2251_c1_g3_i1.p1 TRINITY_DN2251_c1_g3~~TRINITY_DN2251_c1_g3_i1.p1  ORF type:complete len:174 (+),score=28.96 TRINITY_DN2251_c1_g3_i1:82-603(+)
MMYGGYGGLGECPQNEMMMMQMAMMGVKPTHQEQNRHQRKPPRDQGWCGEQVTQHLMYQQQLQMMGMHRVKPQQEYGSGLYSANGKWYPNYDPELAESDRSLMFTIPTEMSEREWVKMQLAAEGYPDSDDDKPVRQKRAAPKPAEPTKDEIIAFFDTQEQQKNIASMQGLLDK